MENPMKINDYDGLNHGLWWFIRENPNLKWMMNKGISMYENPHAWPLEILRTDILETLSC